MSLNYFFDTEKGKAIGFRIGALDIDTDELKTDTMTSNNIITNTMKIGEVDIEAYSGNNGDVMTIIEPGFASFQPIPPIPPTERGNETLYQCVSTTSIIFPNGMIETDFFNLGRAVDTSLLRDGSKITCYFTGAVSAGGVGTWNLTLRLYICNISVDYVITLPASVIIASQFRAKIELTIRTAGVTGSTYMIGEAEYTTDAGVYKRDLQQIGFGGIDTTSTANFLRATGQFNGSPTGLSVNIRGGEIVLHNVID